MAVEVSTPDFANANPQFQATRDAPMNAPASVFTVAGTLASELFDDHLTNVRAPKNKKVVPIVTVAVSYRFESTKE